MTYIASKDNQTYPFMKSLPTKAFEKHMEVIGVRCNSFTCSGLLVINTDILKE